MENQLDQFKEQVPIVKFQPESKKSFYKIWFVVVMIVIVAVTIGFYFFYFDGEFFAKEYGGKTPEETLNLLIVALEVGDVGLASKYFAPDDTGSSKMWEDGWRQAKEEGRLPEIIGQLKQMQPNPNNLTHAGDFKYVIRDESGAITAEINFELDPETKVWKVESL